MEEKARWRYEGTTFRWCEIELELPTTLSNTPLLTKVRNLPFLSPSVLTEVLGHNRM